LIIRIFSSLPEYINGVVPLSILGRAQHEGLINIQVVDIKQYGLGNHRQIDDTTYGGGAGMVMRADVLGKCLEANINFNQPSPPNIILTSPRGRPFNQNMATQLSQLHEINIVCNRFEAIDQRAIGYYNMQEVSIGNYILLGGEVASLVMLEAICRLQSGVIKNNEACTEESFSSTMEYEIEYDHYTKPAMWNNLSVPTDLQSGNHQAIKQWRTNSSRVRTQQFKNNVHSS
jgi:tRNA (guanine37-N1)-methyltransferase